MCDEVVMCDQTEISYSDGQIVWVKLGSFFWPGEVIGSDKVHPDVLKSFRKPPIAIVKFFQEDTYEYVRNANSIYNYQCSRKFEFIKKGLDMYRAKRGRLEKFPEDVIQAESLTNGDEKILLNEEFQEVKKESYAGIFGDPKTPASGKRGRGAKSKQTETPTFSPFRKIKKENSDYKVTILLQDSKNSVEHSNLDAQASTSKSPEVDTTRLSKTPATPSSGQDGGMYKCHACPFSTSRLNLMIMHNKTHSVSFTQYTPSPIRKKPTTKSTIKTTPKSSKTTNQTKESKTPRAPKSRRDKSRNKVNNTSKRIAEDKVEVLPNKKTKTDEEIKSSLLADWDDEWGDEKEEEKATTVSPEVPKSAHSPDVPVSADTIHIDVTDSVNNAKNAVEKSPNEKIEVSTDSKYEFCEDEDWPLEADAGRKIPRVKNSSKLRNDVQTFNLDEQDVAKEVKDLLEKTVVPELPSAPEPLKVEENFPEVSIVKSPDKEKSQLSQKLSPKKIDETQTKTIFKTKTFFRSRHSRSQDAIEKYVAEQLNSTEKMDSMDCDMNGSDATTPSPEARDSPPIEPVKVTRHAPKIQLKMMKAEAAQMKEKSASNYFDSDITLNKHSIPVSNVEQKLSTDNEILEISHSKKTAENSIISENSEAVLENNNVNVDSDLLYNKVVDPDIFIEKPKHNITTEEELNDGPAGTNTESPNNDMDNMKNDETLDLSLQQQNDSLQSSDTRHYTNETTKVTNLPDILFEDDQPDANNEDTNVVYATDCETMESKEETCEENYKAEIKKKTILTCLATEENLNSTVDTSVKENIVDDNSTTEHKRDVFPDILIDNNEELIPENNPVSVVIEQSIDENNTDMVSAANVEVVTQSNALEGIAEEDKTYISEGDVLTEEVVTEDNVEVDKTYDTEENGLMEEIVTEEILEEHKTGITGNALKDEIVKGDIIEEDKSYNRHDIATEVILKENEAIEECKSSYELEKEPTDSDIQVAEALMNLPSTHKQSPIIENTTPSQRLEGEISAKELQACPVNKVLTINDALNFSDENVHSGGVNVFKKVPTHVRYETEEEKSQNLNAAKSLVEMSGQISEQLPGACDSEVDGRSDVTNKTSLVKKSTTITDQKDKLTPSNTRQPISKLMQILEEPKVMKKTSKPVHPNSLILPRRDKIINNEGKVTTKITRTNQPTLIRRSHKNVVNKDMQEQIILSRTKSTVDGSKVETYTIKGSSEVSSDTNPIIMQQRGKIDKNVPTKQMQRFNSPSQASLLGRRKEPKLLNRSNDDDIFDINSMPVVLSDDIVTPENIDQMPIVMSDGNLLTNSPPPLVIASKTIKQVDKTQTTIAKVADKQNKSQMKTLLLNLSSDVGRTNTPNILSKSSKARANSILVLSKETGKQKIVIVNSEPMPSEPIKPTVLHEARAGKSEKILIVPTSKPQRGNQTQKIVLDPRSGKAHVFVSATNEPLSLTESKSLSAKLLAAPADSATEGGKIMIITNAQGGQSKLHLRPEHEKILFPKRQTPMSQIKTVTHRQIAVTNVQKQVISSPMNQAAIVPQQICSKQQVKTMVKPKSTIITSKGQLIIGGRLTTTLPSKTQISDFKQTVTQKRILPDPTVIKKISSEPVILLQQKCGSIVRLTPQEFEELQRKGQFVSKTVSTQGTTATAPPNRVPTKENKIIIQKSITIKPPNESPVSVSHKIQKPRSRLLKTPTEKLRRIKEDTLTSPFALQNPPPLTAISTPRINNTSKQSLLIPEGQPTTSAAAYADLDNFEDLLPSTAIVRQPDTVLQVEATAPPPESVESTNPFPDGNLLAVPGEHFGGPQGTFYLCVEKKGMIVPIDDRPLVLENDQLVPMKVEPVPTLAAQPERIDILEAALANSDVFHADTPRDEAPDFRDLNANVSVHCCVSETSSTLNQPIMTPVEVPSKGESDPTVVSSLEDGLAVIGVTPHSVPTSLELPITVTDPRIAPKTSADPLSGTSYSAPLLHSPNIDMYVDSEQTVQSGPINMPLLNDEDDGIGKSMPILTDDINEKTVSSDIGSSSSLEVRDVELEGGNNWSQRLLTPGSDSSDASVEIPFQPTIQVSADDLIRR